MRLRAARHPALPMMSMAVTATILGVLPVFLLGGLAVQVRDDLGFSETALGVAVSTFFAASSLLSVPGGRLSERIGAERGILLGAVASLLSLLSIAAVAGSLPTLLACMAVGGMGNGITQPAVNLALARGVPLARQGFAFGLKQSSIPIATLLGGLAVPLIALTIGWRWAYASGAVVAALLAVWTLTRRRTEQSPSRPSHRHAQDRRSQRRSLVRLATAGGLASAASNSLGAFLVLWGVTAGLHPATSGLLFAMGSAFSIVVRISLGRLADTHPASALRMVTGLMLLGGCGFVALATGSLPWLYVAGTLLGFGAGWGWPGLFTLAIVRTHPEAPAAATGVTQAGIYAGGVIGPTLLGLLVETVSYPAAWLAGAASLVAAAALVAAEDG